MLVVCFLLLVGFVIALFESDLCGTVHGVNDLLRIGRAGVDSRRENGFGLGRGSGKVVWWNEVGGVRVFRRSLKGFEKYLVQDRRRINVVRSQCGSLESI